MHTTSAQSCWAAVFVCQMAQKLSQQLGCLIFLCLCRSAEKMSHFLFRWRAFSVYFLATKSSVQRLKCCHTWATCLLSLQVKTSACICLWMHSYFIFFQNNLGALAAEHLHPWTWIEASQSTWNLIHFLSVVIFHLRALRSIEAAIFFPPGWMVCSSSTYLLNHAGRQRPVRVPVCDMHFSHVFSPASFSILMAQLLPHVGTPTLSSRIGRWGQVHAFVYERVNVFYFQNHRILGFETRFSNAIATLFYCMFFWMFSEAPEVKVGSIFVVWMTQILPSMGWFLLVFAGGWRQVHAAHGKALQAAARQGRLRRQGRGSQGAGSHTGEGIYVCMLVATHRHAS